MTILLLLLGLFVLIAIDVPIGVALLFLMGVGPALPWGRATKQQMVKALVPPIIGGIVVMAVGLLAGARNPWTVVALFFGGYAAQVTLKEMWLPMTQRLRKGAGISEALVETQLRRGRRRFAFHTWKCSWHAVPSQRRYSRRCA